MNITDHGDGTLTTPCTQTSESYSIPGKPLYFLNVSVKSKNILKIAYVLQIIYTYNILYQKEPCGFFQVGTQ